LFVGWFSVALKEWVHEEIGASHEYEAAKQKGEGEVDNQKDLIPILVADASDSLFDSGLDSFRDLDLTGVACEDTIQLFILGQLHINLNRINIGWSL
jgi:hypothetical protein